VAQDNKTTSLITHGRRGLGITPEPVLVAQVKFTDEWTHDGRLRQPVFLGLRTDKEPKDVVVTLIYQRLTHAPPPP
jgi:ATP-dependent DNA ligase